MECYQESGSEEGEGTGVRPWAVVGVRPWAVVGSSCCSNHPFHDAEETAHTLIIQTAYSSVSVSPSCFICLRSRPTKLLSCFSQEEEESDVVRELL
jgi:hypothetical protein